PAPAPPSVNYGIPNTEGGDLLSENVAIPKGTRVELHDKSNQYSHGFSDDKGTEVAEQGRLITTNGGWEYVVAKTGSYQYISPEGKKIRVSYTADENGYHPTIESD
ncbi:pupal cuticle protein Edg-78E-like, partial [Frankliniella occidentalis]|uniref:Pupal cuticle protein Edg-78E-like n=1 Tax=Frankliniella occidentalis TaxID=133901 RepID=A0A6J1SAI2_FRAOC